MGKRWLELILSIATLVSAAISIAILFRKAREIELASSEAKVANQPKYKRFFYGVKKHCKDEINIVAIIIFVAIIFTLFAFFTSCDIPEIAHAAETTSAEILPDNASTPTQNPLSTPKTDPILTSPTNFQSIYLCDLQPLITNNDAFFNFNWDKFDDLIVGDETIKHGIGIQVPKDDNTNYYRKSSNKRVQHEEYIEYPLGGKYDHLDFEFGIDKSSFELIQSEAPACLCRIIIQDAPSNGFLADSENIIFDSSWFNYRLVRHSASIDVSGLETIRVTAFWDFNVSPTMDNSLKLVLIDPKLLY